jgi:hypothetical protein
MRRNAFFFWVIFCVLAGTSSCRKPSPDWNGRWKLNPSKGNFQGPVFTVSISPEGEYRYEDGASRLAFLCDAKERPTGNNRTQACVKSATTLDLTRKENGAKTNTYHWELSADGTVLTATGTVFPPSGAVITTQIVASRMSGSRDFAGQWRDTSYLQQHAEMALRVDRKALHISYPNNGQDIDAPFDGADMAVHGPRAPEGVTYTAQLVGRRQILTVAKRNGLVSMQGSLELSDDGKVITESWWNPVRPDNKGRFVYEKE